MPTVRHTTVSVQVYASLPVKCLHSTSQLSKTQSPPKVREGSPFCPRNPRKNAHKKSNHKESRQRMIFLFSLTSSNPLPLFPICLQYRSNVTRLIERYRLQERNKRYQVGGIAFGRGWVYITRGLISTRNKESNNKGGRTKFSSKERSEKKKKKKKKEEI
jgi:hypothetical protein